MPQFEIKFMKRIAGPRGREIEVCASSFHITAPSPYEASGLATQQFTKEIGSPHWTGYADWIEIIESGQSGGNRAPPDLPKAVGA